MKEKQEFLKTRAKRLAEESIKHIRRTLWYPRILFLINTSLIFIHLALVPELQGTFRFLLLTMFFLWVVYEFLVVKLLVSSHSRLGFTVKFAQGVGRRTLLRRFDGRVSVKKISADKYEILVKDDRDFGNILQAILSEFRVEYIC